MTVITYKWSIDEWHQLVDTGVLAGRPVELLGGEIIVRWSAPTQAGACRLPSAGEALQSLLANPHSGLSPEREQHSYTNDDVAEYLRDLLRGKAKIRESHPVTLDNSEPEPDIARQSPKVIRQCQGHCRKPPGFVARVSRVEGTVEGAIVKLPNSIA